MIATKTINALGITIYVIVISVEVVKGTDIGVAYSPLIRRGDSHNTQSYTKEMIKVMLEVVLDSGLDYTSVTTYGVGSPNRWPFDNQTIAACSSFVHISMAAAEINKARNYLAMTLYQGMYHSKYEDQVKCEIEVGLKIAEQANQLFDGTVPGIIYPSTVAFNDLIDNEDYHNKLKEVSVRTRNLNMTFGVRITDCANVRTTNKEKIRDVFSYYDFIICLECPNQGAFDFGPEKFKENAIRNLIQAAEYLESGVGLKNRVELILETGWPGDPELEPPKSVKNLIGYWTAIIEWANLNRKRVFLHEAFDSPWKEDELRDISMAGRFGRWKYNEKERNLLSKNAYILKQAPETVMDARSFFEKNSWAIIGSLVGFIFIISLITVIALLYRRVSRIEVVAATAILNEYDVKMFFDGVGEDNPAYAGDIWEKSPYNTSLEITKDQIIIDKTDAGLLGKGQFGCVYRGMLTTSEARQVAVKMTRSFCPLSEIKCLLSEIKMLIYIGSHPHVCGILGANTKEISMGIVYFAMELCTYGNLEGYLQKNKSKFEQDLKNINSSGKVYDMQSTMDTCSLSENQLVRWSYEIASAMSYISSKNIIHSDLAARNVLLTVEYSIKVTDFGLSRRFQEDEPNYAKLGTEPLPWKWLAPESLEFKHFSKKSDVWAYGVTIWEIFSLGAAPRYKLVHNWKDLLPHFQTGGRLDKPEFAPKEIYKIMTKCWELEPAHRPPFEEIMHALVVLINNDYKDLCDE